ncbi:MULTISPECIES: LacI family DNA-binding transcriptional regulator [unclassified Kribbella]|uniref:LacI family DNA-binding transcriptional regulator n=1 Tax=unclassified Kribbella TaxID=2644121 RepID=UPI00340E5193
MSDGRPSIRDVAARAGVSVTTVSRILNGSYPPAPKTRDKVMRAVQELDYVANPHARALTRQGTGTIALVVMMLDDGFLMNLVESIATGVAEAGKLCLIGTSGGDLDRELAVLRQMHAQHVEAIILVGAVVESDEYRERMSAFAAQLRQSGTRLVLCARPPIDPSFQDASVEYDNEGGAYAATSHLLSRGHRRILLLGGPDGQSITTRRSIGYRNALRDLGGDLDPSLEIHPAWNRESGYARMRELLDAGPPAFTGVLAHTDHVAAGAMQALRDAGLRVPDDISVVGFNNDSFAADLQLTTVHIPARELGRTAAALAIAPSPTEPHTTLGTHVVIRDTVRAVRR